MSHSTMLFRAASILIVVCGFHNRSMAIPLNWDGGGGNEFWGNNSNWDPPLEPDSDDDVTIAGVLMGAGPHTVLDADYVIASLTLQNSSEVDTSNFLLAVEGHTQLSGTGTRLLLRERTTGGDGDTLDTDTLSIGTGSFVEMYENSVLEVDDGLFSVFGTLVGNGTVELVDNPAAPTALLSIFGTVSAGQAGTFVGPPPPRTMTITATDLDARIDMAALGVIEVQENATLDNHVRMLNDNLANLRLWPNSTYQMDHSWHLVGYIDISTGLGSGTDPATIAGGQAGLLLTLDSGSTVTVDAGESLRFDIELLAENGNVVANSGTIIFDETAQFDQMADLSMLGNFASLVVNAPVTITQDTFHLDGNDNLSNTITVNAGGVLTVDVGAIDISDNIADGTIGVNSGVLELRTESPGWSMNGEMTLNNSESAPAIVRNISGGPIQTLQIGDDNGANDARLIVGGNGESVIEYEFVGFRSDANVDIAAGATLNINGVSSFLDSGATFDGEGTFKPGRMTVGADTTFNIAVVDLDDELVPGVAPHSLNASLTINADSIDEEGDGMDSAITIHNLALLTVNLSGGGAWTVGPAGSITYDGLGPDHTFLAGSNVVLNGPLNIDGSGITEAVLNIGAVEVNLNSGGLRLSGGDSGVNATNANTIAGGTINGPGELRAGDSRSLRGFGTINAPIDFNGFGGLQADNGTLTINGTIVDVGVIGPGDFDGVLNVVVAWNSNIAEFVDLLGGELTGGAITNDNVNGITGVGLVSARVINNQRFRAQGGGTLVVETAANNNDWDGVLGTGRLVAGSGHLEVRDDATFLFGGTVEAINNRMVFANGFELEFQPSSTLSLTSGIYRSTHATNIGGTVTIGPGTSSLEIAGTTVFENGSSTTLTGDLRLDNAATRIDAGATLSGTGSLINVADRTLTIADGADVDVTLQNDGTLELGASAGQSQGLDFSQSASGSWHVELGGTGLNDFDRMSLSGIASLSGALNLSLIDGYFPALTDGALTILTASVRSGTFSSVVQPAGMPAGLQFDVIYNPNNVMLQVVEAGLPGDYNDDGTVDAADYTVWRDHLGQIFTLANEDPSTTPGEVTPEDYDVWRMNFGNTDGSGSLSSVTVPEPGGLALLAIGFIVPLMRLHVKQKSIVRIESHLI